MRMLTIGAMVCALVSVSHAIRAATFTVNSIDDRVDAAPGDGACATSKGICTLRAAIQEANALAGADTITLPAGMVTLSLAGRGEDAGATGDLDITDDLTINGAGTTVSVINSNHIDRVFDVHQSVNVGLSNLKINGGEPDPQEAGGGMLNHGMVTLTNVSFSSNRAGRNHTGGTGGGLENFGTATLTGVTFIHNAAGDAGEQDSAGAGGGMDNEGIATLTDVTFTGNRAGDGDPIRNTYHEGGWGGGMANVATATLTDVVFLSNRAGKGGFTGLGGLGGGLANLDTTTMKRVTFLRNRAGTGGSNTEEDGGDGGGGGGLENYSGTAMLTDVSFIDNGAGRGGFPFGCGGSGGGMENQASATLTNATFDRNRAGVGVFCQGGDGGGMWGDATLINVTMTRNRAGRGAGRGYNYADGGSGGGLCTSAGGATLTNVTLARNLAGKGTAGYNGSGDNLSGGGTLTNTIIVGPGQSCDVAVVSQGHNLDSGITCGLKAAGDLSNTDPLLDKLRDNGGFTPTMALRPGSPAIDAGDNGACPAADQRGIARPQGAVCDIGAYELQP